MLIIKLPNRLINKITCTALLIGTLPTNLFLNGRPQKTEELNTLRMEIDREISVIKQTVSRLKTAQIITPAMFMGTGIAFTAATMAVLCIFSGLKLGKGIQKIQEKFIEIKRNSVHDIQTDEYWAHRTLHAMQSYLPKNLRPVAHYRILETSNQNTPGIEILKDVIKQVLKPKRNNLIFWTFFYSVVGILGTRMVAMGSLFNSSKIPITEAYNSAKKIEQVVKKYPGILTPQQDFILTQLKRLSKSVITREIIKNTRIEDALMETVDTAIQQNFLLVSALGGQKEAHKIFTAYIKLRYQEELFKKMLVADTGILKSLFRKFQLKKIKKKIEKLEALHPHMTFALKNTMQMYTTKTNAILEELYDEKT